MACPYYQGSNPCLATLQRYPVGSNPFLEEPMAPVCSINFGRSVSHLWKACESESSRGDAAGKALYKDDAFDRLWKTRHRNAWDVVKSSVEGNTENSTYELPLEKLPSDRKRIINVTFDDDDNSSPAHVLTLQYLKPVTLSSNKISKGYVSFTIIATADSDAPPILNAYEIYEAISQPNSPTATQDVDALLEIKHTYGISRISWVLSNNELAGQLPEFLSTLLNLKFTKLTGSIPNALKENAELQLSVSNNPGLCQKNSCQKHNFVIPLIASVAALVILIVIVALVIWRLRHKRDKTWSLMKCASISMCLVLAWCTGFEASAAALVLSHHMVGILLIFSFSSESREEIQHNSVAMLARDLYSDSVLDLATTFCFLEDQVTKESPIKTQYPPIDLLSSGQEAQSASEYAIISSNVDGFKWMP
ncbi:probable LRR receptor-like serine/threonine-protein kinase At1g51820 [Neltuma alba]|uniref:probable LRR receptor-like serine/threonine-protein kinase At1g51820 n=1 Tax=Neltuma alba TaxID=207710 RepID=UPI0010A542CB|nr:probable LRR receptor-like serine/threonine-protein kinase At1g51820 [Prosopis alba]